jgi:hypothetical protein
MTVNYIAKVFNEQFDKIQKTIDFKEDFKNNTGYLNGVVEFAEVPEGEIVKMVDDFGRRCILIGTLFGTTVVFQRYADSEDRYVCNLPRELERFGFHLTGNRIESEATLHHFFGTWEPNIGEKLRDLNKRLDQLNSARKVASND